MRQRRVGFITVHYRNAAVTRAFLESLVRLDGFDQCEVAIVDNETDARSRADLTAMVEGLGGCVRVFGSEKNRFYWGGAAFALEQLYPRVELMPDWVIVCNNDVVIADRAFIAKLLGYDAQRVGVVAPSILSTLTGKDQNPFLRTELGAFERLKWRAYYSHYVVARSLLAVRRLWTLATERRRPPGDGAPGGAAPEERIYAPHGACIVFSKLYFQKGGYLDTNFALYGEEITVAEIAKRIDVPVAYCPRLQVVHHENAATGRKLTRALYRMEREAHTYFTREYLSSGS